jgi:beta-N-acetylhexosaminidase
MTDSQTLLSLPLEKQIGQLLFIGLPGTELDAEARALVEEVSPGGVIVFGRNVATPEQLRGLLDGVRAMMRVEPLVGIDQEGGLVDRLRKICTPMPAARVIRQHGDLAAARAHGRITGEVLRLLGFNMNFAPVMSIMTEDRDLLSNGLYSRSFGRSPGEVLGYTMVYLRGLQGSGLLGCAKHFPGIGAGEVDTHDEMAVIHLSHDDLIAQDIDIHRGIAGGRLVPASINPSIVRDLLRDELGYEGLVVTDDLEMGAIAKHSEIEESALRAILAGEDMILVCARPDLIRRAYNSLLDAARRGELSRGRIQASLRRIATFKSTTKPPLNFDPKRFQELSMEIAELNRKLNYTYGGKF